MRPRFKSIAIYAAALPMVALMACEGADLSKTDDLPAVNVDAFTTEGKPTKTVQTPWGDTQVYDPTQDAEVIEAFEYVKRTHQRHGPNKKYDQLKRYDILFSRIRDIQYLDMGRVGCQDMKRPKCNDVFNNFTQNTIRENCPVPSFGSPSLDACEANHSILKPEFEDEVIALNVAHLPSRCSSAYFGYIGSIDRQDTLGSREETVSEYFKLSCNSFEGRIENGDRERVAQ